MAKSRALNLVINSISNFSGYAISIALGLISYPIIIDQIGLEAFGIYALIAAVLAPMDLTNLGFAEATIKYVAQFAQSHDLVKVKQYISTTLFMSVVTGVVGMLIIFFVGPSVGTALFDFKSETYETITLCFGIAAVGWLVRQLTAVFLSIPSAFQKFKIVALGNTITSILTTGSILVTLVFMKNLTGFALGSLIGALLTMLYWYLVTMISFSEIKYSIKFHKEVWQSSLVYGGWQTLGSVGSLVTNQTDKYFLGIYLPASASGIYNVIFQVEQRILSAIWKIAEVMFPLFSASSGEGTSSKFNALTRSNYILSAMGIIIFFPVIILSYPTLRIWMGADFAEQGNIVMKCLLMIGTFASITVVQTFFLMGNARVKEVTLIAYFTGGCTAVGSIIFIPMYGLNGAGYGILFASVTRLLLFYFIMKRFFQNDFEIRAYLISTLLPMIGGLLILIPLYYFPILRPDNFIYLFIDFALVAGLLGGCIIMLNFLFPIARIHNAGLLILIKEVSRLISKNKV